MDNDNTKAFEEVVKKDEREWTIADLGPDDFECTCEMCMMGLDIIPAKKA